MGMGSLRIPCHCKLLRRRCRSQYFERRIIDSYSVMKWAIWPGLVEGSNHTGEAHLNSHICLKILDCSKHGLSWEGLGPKGTWESMDLPGRTVRTCCFSHLDSKNGWTRSTLCRNSCLPSEQLLLDWGWSAWAPFPMTFWLTPVHCGTQAFQSQLYVHSHRVSLHSNYLESGLCGQPIYPLEFRT